MEHYRLAVLNDFKNIKAYIEVKKFPEAVITDISLTSSEHRGFNLADDSISIFINYTMVANYKTKQEALLEIERIINSHTGPLKTELELFKDYLIRAIS